MTTYEKINSQEEFISLPPGTILIASDDVSYNTTNPIRYLVGIDDGMDDYDGQGARVIELNPGRSSKPPNAFRLSHMYYGYYNRELAE